MHENYVIVQGEAVRHICLRKSRQQRGVSFQYATRLHVPGHIQDGMSKGWGSARQTHDNWSYTGCTGSKGVIGEQCRGPNELFS